jgi:hypothetical protein
MFYAICVLKPKYVLLLLSRKSPALFETALPIKFSEKGLVRTHNIFSNCPQQSELMHEYV